MTGERLEDGLGAIFHRVPDLETAGIKRGVNGAISFAPDGRPMIGPMPGVPGFFGGLWLSWRHRAGRRHRPGNEPMDTGG